MGTSAQLCVLWTVYVLCTHVYLPCASTPCRLCTVAISVCILCCAHIKVMYIINACLCFVVDVCMYALQGGSVRRIHTVPTSAEQFLELARHGPFVIDTRHNTSTHDTAHAQLGAFEAAFGWRTKLWSEAYFAERVGDANAVVHSHPADMTV